MAVTFPPDPILLFFLFYCEKWEKYIDSQVTFEMGVVKPVGKESVKQFMKQKFSLAGALQFQADEQWWERRYIY